MKKITLEEFFESTDLLRIHCDTSEKANKLLKAFHDYGKKWASEDSYLSYTFWEEYKENTIYYNDGTYGCLKTELLYRADTYEFEDIIFE